MRTALFLVAGLLLLGAALLLGKLFSNPLSRSHVRGDRRYVALWLIIAGANMLGRRREGGLFGDRGAPHLFFLSRVPAAAAILLKWRFPMNRAGGARMRSGYAESLPNAGLVLGGESNPTHVQVLARGATTSVKLNQQGRSGETDHARSPAAHGRSNTCNAVFLFALLTGLPSSSMPAAPPDARTTSALPYRIFAW